MSQSIFDQRNRGRLIDEKRRRAHRDGRRAFRADQTKASAAGVAPAATQHQAVIKVVSWGKSSRSAMTTARYITRSRPKDAEGLALAAITASGQRIPPAELAAYLDSWALLPDNLNLSAAARALSSSERLQMPEKDRLDRRQIGHMILSIPAAAGASPEQVEAIARDTLQETFSAKGNDYLYVVHTDHSSRPHAHVMFQARTQDRQIRLGPEDLRVIREVFAEKGRDYGIALVATAREDRAELAQELADGKVKARPNRRYIDAREGKGENEPWLATRAPLYHARHGAAYQQRFLGADTTARVPEPSPIALPAFPHKQGRLIEHACQNFTDPDSAKRNFAELYAEAPAFALWSMNNRPEVIGQVRPEARAPKLYLRKAERATTSQRFEESPVKVQELDRRMRAAHGANWRQDIDALLRSGDSVRGVPVIKSEQQFKRVIERDPQFNEPDPFAGSLKAWREQARGVISAPTQEPRQVQAARAAAEKAARSAVAQRRLERSVVMNKVTMRRATERFGGGHPHVEIRTESVPAESAAKSAAGKALPKWLDRMLGRKDGHATTPAPIAPSPGLEAPRPQQKPAPAPVQDQTAALQQPQQKRTAQRRHSRDDDRGRE